MALVVVGLSHKTAPIALREKLAIADDELTNALQRVNTVSGLRGAVLISTCNRTELYADFVEEERAYELLVRSLIDVTRTDDTDLKQHLYCHVNEDAVKHIFRVAASLDSMIIGEPQILGQLKAAFATAKQQRVAKGLIPRVFDRAFRVAKKVRNETGIAANAVSVSYAAVELARKIFGALEGRRMLVLGAGKMGGLTLKHLVSAGVEELYIANRTHKKAVDLAVEVGGVALRWEDLFLRMSEVDIVLGSASAPEFLVTREQAAEVMAGRRGRPLFLIDIAVPRCLDPRVHELDNVYLYDIDDLKSVVDENLKRRRVEAEAAEQIVANETQKFASGLSHLELNPTLSEFREHWESIRVNEISRHLGNGNGVPPETVEVVERVTRSLLNKLAHRPIVELKRAHGSTDSLAVFEALKRALIPDERSTDKKDES